MGDQVFQRGTRSQQVSVPPAAVGLVLGGGIMRGAAHLGVLHVLEAAGVRPSVVTGSSVGAIIGAGVAAGVSGDEMWETFRGLTWKHVAKPSWGSKLSMFASHPIGELITRVTGVSALEDLDLPFAAVACDLLTGTRVVLTQGDLHTALSGTSAMPGVFEPVRREGAWLIDGGIIDNLPVDVARDLGADYVIAVDIMPPLSGTVQPKDAREVLEMAWGIVEHNTVYSRDDAEMVLFPDLAEVSLTDPRQLGEAYQRGVEAAEAALPDILKDLAGPE